MTTVVDSKLNEFGRVSVEFYRLNNLNSILTLRRFSRTDLMKGPRRETGSGRGECPYYRRLPSQSTPTSRLGTGSSGATVRYV